MFAAIGIIGGAIAFLSNVPYIRDTLRGVTQPHRVTWFIFLILNLIYFVNNLAAGATNSMWLVSGFVVASATVSALSVRHGVGGSDKLDILILIGAVVGVIIWLLLDSPVYSIVANLFVASIAIVPTFKKAYLQPWSETKSKWYLNSLGSALAAISVGSFDIALLLLPVYSAIASGALFVIIQTRRN